MTPTNLHEFFLQKLQKLYAAEQLLIAALPQVAATAANPELREGVDAHLAQTREQAQRLEALSGELNYEPAGGEDPVMQALISEGENKMTEISDPVLLDLALIGGSAAIEHYEMACYTEAILMAKLMKHDNAERALRSSLQEEVDTSKILENLAEKIGKQAKDQMGEMESE